MKWKDYIQIIERHPAFNIVSTGVIIAYSIIIGIIQFKYIVYNPLLILK